MININIKTEEIHRSYKFAKDIIEQNNQYNRFDKSIQTQINRTYIGKLAEYVFLHYLQELGKDITEGHMFEIYDGVENADDSDFILKDGRTIDIKTASLPFHQRIMIPISQLHLKKDIYIGIKLNFLETNRYGILNYTKIDNANIYGYIEREIIAATNTQNFGEGDCKAYLLNDLKPINNIIHKF
jgi:hypothetical protein